MEVGQVFTFGAEKYSPDNYLYGAAWSRYYGAALRHMTAWHEGEDEDEETGLNHLAHAICCLMILYTSQFYARGKDDRMPARIETTSNG